MSDVPLSSFSLFAATPEQVLESRKRSFHFWGTSSGWTLENYLLRDATCDAFEAARDGKLITWVLAPRDDPTTLDFACSCKTYRRKGLVLQRLRTNSNTIQRPDVEEVTCYGIATVYTAPSKRGHGYARHMMRLLHWAIAPDSAFTAPFPEESWGAPPSKVDEAYYARFSSLWSDVGRNFYESCGPSPTVHNGGWVVRDVQSTVWRVETGGSAQAKEDYDEWQWLDKTGVERIWKEEAEEIKKDVLLAWDSLTLGKVLFTYLPHEGTGAFLYQRNTLAVEKVTPPVETFGVVSRADRRLFATWAMDIRPPSPPTLIITRIRATPTTFEALLEKVTESARIHGMNRVEVWNLDKSLAKLATKLGGQTAPLREHLASFKWYGAEVAEDIVWVFNEKCVGLIAIIEVEFSNVYTVNAVGSAGVRI